MRGAILLAALLLAGCARPAPLETAHVAAPTPDPALALAEALAALPDPLALDATLATPKGDLHVRATYAGADALVEVTGAPDALVAASGQSAAFAPLLRGGVTMLLQGGRATYLAGGMVFPRDDDAHARASPLAPLLDGRAFLREAARAAPGDANFTVSGAPPRLARAVFAWPAAPFAGAPIDITVAEGALDPPAALLRARALAYASDARPGAGNVTWRFIGAGGIPLDELAVEVKRTEGATDPLALPTAWRMGLAEGERAQEGVRVRFRDADASGTVSPGDTLAAAADEGALPPVLLVDEATGARIVPALPGSSLLALALLVALARRKL